MNEGNAHNSHEMVMYLNCLFKTPSYQNLKSLSCIKRLVDCHGYKTFYIIL